MPLLLLKVIVAAYAVALLLALCGTLFLALQGLWLEARLRRRLPPARELRSGLRRARRGRTLELLRGAPPRLVLSGGGGKGAYEIGCLRALERLGVSNFSEIAGTSVGALNAALVAQGGLRAACGIWERISLGRVLTLSPPLLFAAVALRLLLLPFYFLRRRPSFWQAANTYLAFSRRHELAPLGLYVGVFRALISPQRWLELLFQVAPLALLSLAFGGDTAGRELHVLGLVAFLPALLAGVLTVWLSLHWVDDLVARKLPITSNSPLARMLEDVLDPEKIKDRAHPVWVTTAGIGLIPRPPKETSLHPAALRGADGGAGRPVVIVKPPAGVNEKVDGDYGTLQRGDGATGDDRVGYIPLYKDLRKMGKATIAEYVLQSAGLPEVFPRKVIDGHALVDGGVIDNTPLLPTLARPAAESEATVVIFLEGGGHAGQRLEVMRKRLDEVYHRLTRGRLAVGAGLEESRPEVGAGDGAPEGVRVAVVGISPSLHPGNLLNGTLNFSSGKSRALMWLGYRDTLLALEAPAVELKWEPKGGNVYEVLAGKLSPPEKAENPLQELLGRRFGWWAKSGGREGDKAK